MRFYLCELNLLFRRLFLQHLSHSPSFVLTLFSFFMAIYYSSSNTFILLLLIPISLITYLLHPFFHYFIFISNSATLLILSLSLLKLSHTEYLCYTLLKQEHYSPVLLKITSK